MTPKLSIRAQAARRERATRTTALLADHDHR